MHVSTFFMVDFILLLMYDDDDDDDDKDDVGRMDQGKVGWWRKGQLGIPAAALPCCPQFNLSLA